MVIIQADVYNVPIYLSSSVVLSKYLCIYICIYVSTCASVCLILVMSRGRRGWRMVKLKE